MEESSRPLYIAQAVSGQSYLLMLAGRLKQPAINRIHESVGYTTYRESNKSYLQDIKVRRKIVQCGPNTARS